MLPLRFFLLALALLICSACTTKALINFDFIYRTNEDGTVSKYRQGELFQYESHLANLEVQPNVIEMFVFDINHLQEQTRGGFIQINVTLGGAMLWYVETYPDDTRSGVYYRKFTAAELEELRAFVAKQDVDHWRYSDDHNIDIQYQWLHATAFGKPRHVYINTPTEGKKPEQIQLVKLMQKFLDVRPITCGSTKFTDPQAERRFSDPLLEVRQVWADGDDIHLCVGPKNELRPKVVDLEVDVDRAEGEEKQIKKSQWWIQLKDRHKCDPPPVELPHDLEMETKWPAEFGQPPAALQDARRQVISHRLVVRETNQYLCVIDGFLRCFDLKTRQEIPLDDPKSLIGYMPFEYFPEVKGVLLVKYETDAYGKRSPARWKRLDPATNKATHIDFYYGSKVYPRPRKLQPTPQGDLYWVTELDENKGTTLTRLDREGLCVYGGQKLKGLYADSSHIWVDNKRSFLYLIHNGDLFSVELDFDCKDEPRPGRMGR